MKDIQQVTNSQEVSTITWTDIWQSHNLKELWSKKLKCSVVPKIYSKLYLSDVQALEKTKRWCSNRFYQNIIRSIKCFYQSKANIQPYFSNTNNSYRQNSKKWLIAILADTIMNRSNQTFGLHFNNAHSKEDIDSIQ